MSKRINALLVEDSPGDMVLARKAIAKAALDVKLTIAQTGEQALSHIESTILDLILLDLNLPGISGFDVLRKVRDSSLATGTAIFVLSTSRNPVDRKRALELGASGYQSKPRTYQEYASFVDRVTEFLGTARD